MKLLQSPGITAGQRGDASTVLRDTEDLMVRLGKVFDLS